MSLRFSLAKAAGAVSTWGLRHVARRPAANLPGKIALAIDPSLLDELRGFCFMWAENYNFHEVKEFRCMNWAKGKRRTLVPERASQGGF